MTPHDTETFAKALYVLGEVFDTAVSPVRAHAYFEALADLPLDAVLVAMKAHVKTATFFPKPGELRAAIEGTMEDRADSAVVRLSDMVRRVGAYGRPDWDDPLLERVVRDVFGSWRRCCERLPSEGPELASVTKQVKSVYATQTRREDFGHCRIEAGPDPLLIPEDTAS